MIHFCLAHAAYHFSKWLPKHHSCKLQLSILAFGICMLLFQLYVLLRPRSSQYCNKPLLYNLVASIVFTFITTGLSLLLVLLDPIPRELEITLPIFGAASFAKGVYTAVLTAAAAQCAKTTPELYCLSLFLSLASVISAALFSFLGLLWLANLIFPGLLLNKEEKKGICYEPISECSCLWHV